MLHLGFGSKRKQLVGNLSAKFDRAKVLEVLSKMDISHTVRGEDLSLPQWLGLANQLVK